MEFPIRINKYLSHSTKYSRREADRIIQEGRVNVNRQVVTDLSTQIRPDDHVYLDGKPVKADDGLYTVIVYCKPKGELVSKKDDRGRRLIYDSLPSRFRHFLPVGRLDFVSEGLLLLSDSPTVVTALMEGDLERIYKIKIDGLVTPQMESAMQEGMELDDASAGGHQKSEISSMNFAPFSHYQIDSNRPNYSKLKIALSEGKNREIRRFFAHFGRQVLDLKRVAYGGVELNALPTGKFRFLSKQEYQSLRDYLHDFSTKK